MPTFLLSFNFYAVFFVFFRLVYQFLSYFSNLFFILRKTEIQFAVDNNHPEIPNLCVCELASICWKCHL